MKSYNYNPDQLTNGEGLFIFIMGMFMGALLVWGFTLSAGGY